MGKKYPELYGAFSQLEINIENAFISNVARISEIDKSTEHFILYYSIPISKNREITLVGRNSQLWLQRYDKPLKSKFVSFSYLSCIQQQLKLIRELERIQFIEDL
jgi:hypothetical protein